MDKIFRAHNVDIIACTASVLRSLLSEEVLLLFSQYDCAGSAGIYVLAQGVCIVPGTKAAPFGFCFPPPIMAIRNAQHVKEGKALAVVLLSDVKAY